MLTKILLVLVLLAAASWLHLGSLVSTAPSNASPPVGGACASTGAGRTRSMEDTPTGLCSRRASMVRASPTESRLLRLLPLSLITVSPTVSLTISPTLSRSLCLPPLCLPQVLFGDSLTQRGFEPHGWAAAMAHHYGRRAGTLLPPPCRHFNNQSCVCLGDAFEVAFKPLNPNHTIFQLRWNHQSVASLQAASTWVLPSKRDGL